jgi:hypothetical protein
LPYWQEFEQQQHLRVIFKWKIKHITWILFCHWLLLIFLADQDQYFLMFMGACIVNVFLSMTNKMQRCIILFIIVNAVHVSSGFSAHRQELKSVHAASPSTNFYQYCISPLTTLSITPVRNGSNKLEHAVLIGYENSS